MKKNPYFINVILGLVTAFVCLAGVLTDSFFAVIILPRVDVPMMAGISALSCAILYYINGGVRADKIGSALFAGFTFSVLPFCAGLTFGNPVWKLFVAGTVVFFVTDLCYESIAKRMDTGVYSKLAPLANGLVLFLVSQSFQGLFF